MKKITFLIIILLSSVLILSGCSTEFFGSLPSNSEDKYPSINEKSYIEGEMIVSTSTSGTLGDLSIQEKNNAITEEISEHDDILSQKGFEMESMIEKSESANGKYSLSMEMKEKIIDKMGYMQLVKYPKDEYSSFEEAKKDVKETLEDKGYEINYIIPNYRFETMGSVNEVKSVEEIESQADNSTMHPEQEWHYDMINVPKTWEGVKGNEEVKIAVLDTGIDPDHPYLEDFVDNELAINMLEGEDESDFIDDVGHGTHVAGTIASYGEASGVMKEASLIPVKVLGEDGGSFAEIFAGVTYAVDNKADVINMSLGSPEPLPRGEDETEETQEYIDENLKLARDNNTMVVVAAGNNGDPIISDSGIYPLAGSEYSLAIGAVEENEKIADFSNYGEGLDVMAPGVDIVSTYPEDLSEGEVPLAYMSGTSMAAPHVAGVAGLMRSANPNMTVEDIEYMLKDAAKDMGNEEEYGEGIVDAYKSIRNRVKTPYF